MGIVLNLAFRIPTYSDFHAKHHHGYINNSTVTWLLMNSFSLSNPFRLSSNSAKTLLWSYLVGSKWIGKRRLVFIKKKKIYERRNSLKPRGLFNYWIQRSFFKTNIVIVLTYGINVKVLVLTQFCDEFNSVRYRKMKVASIGFVCWVSRKFSSHTYCIVTRTQFFYKF